MFGRTKWVVGAHLEGDFSEHSDLTPEELAEGCIAFLNRPVGKRKKKCPYGNLELYRSKMNEDDTITVLLVVDQKKNKHFWGKGGTFNGITRRRKKK